MSQIRDYNRRCLCGCMQSTGVLAVLMVVTRKPCCHRGRKRERKKHEGTGDGSSAQLEPSELGEPVLVPREVDVGDARDDEGSACRYARSPPGTLRAPASTWFVVRALGEVEVLGAVRAHVEGGEREILRVRVLLQVRHSSRLQSFKPHKASLDALSEGRADNLLDLGSLESAAGTRIHPSLRITLAGFNF